MEDIIQVGTIASDRLTPFNNKKWNLLRNITERNGPFCKNEFQPSRDILAFLQNYCKVLVLGAGGLGCELLKDLAMCGFGDVHVIDMDIVELSNLNRQFLFRRSDIGQSKAECAARFINRRVPSCRVTPHFRKIEDFDESFYRLFHVIVSGLDSVAARRWINRMLYSCVEYNSDNSLDHSSLIPLIDGGTEGFKGNCRLILPAMTACIECTLDLYPPQITYPLCTIANTPRLPEHCIEYVKVVQWDKANPFNTTLDTDDPAHVKWVYEKSLERAENFNIPGVTYRLTLGVLKNITPAVASTNAVIAAACANEVFKLATSSYDNISTYMVFNNSDGIYTYTYEPSKNEDCTACSCLTKTLFITDPNTVTLQDVIHMLCDESQYRFKQPGITTLKENKSKTLYMPIPASLEQRTRPNLDLSLQELGLQDGQQLLVSDQTTPTPLTFKLKYQQQQQQQQQQQDGIEMD